MDNPKTVTAKSSLLFMLLMLTSLFVGAQISFFFIHYKVTILVDALVNSSISKEILHPIVFVPILFFITLQIVAYILLVIWIWFISVSTGELFNLTNKIVYYLGIVCWFSMCFTICAFNSYYFPHSFFAKYFNQSIFLKETLNIILIITTILLLFVTISAYINYFKCKRHRIIGSFFLLIISLNIVFLIYDYFFNRPVLIPHTSSKPDIIFIGLDSLRPDFIGYFNSQIKTPNIDQFLKNSVIFTKTYTPLARTFPAWISILTAKHPKHSHARNNLVNPTTIINQDTIAKRLTLAGYETIYATDEKRFSNITQDYGFKRVIGPKAGVNDFLLGSLSDFPLTNLLTQLPFARFLFPYHYGNRAAAITYQPDNFLHLLTLGLNDRETKPAFLAVHLCLSHWPFMWARDGSVTDKMPLLYQASVRALDDQFGKLLQLLKENGLLENSIVVLLSDHGTTFGLRGDRLLNQKNYRGESEKIKLIAVSKLSSAPHYSFDFKNDYTIDTAYGQGTDVLSLKQSHVLLAFKKFGSQRFKAKNISVMSSLLDITPTILDILHLSPIQQMDGISLKQSIYQNTMNEKSRMFFMETGDSLSEIEKDDIKIDQVVKNHIGIYQIDSSTGLLQMNSQAEAALIRNKQAAVFWEDWILARYPAHIQLKLVPAKADATKYLFSSSLVPPYFVLANVKSGEWSIGFSSAFAKQAPVNELMQKLKQFYGDEW